VTSKRFALLFVLLFAGISVSAQFPTGYPPRKGAVNDYAGKLTEGQVEELTSLINQYQEKTSIEFVVVVIGDLQGRSARDYAIGVGNAWGVGRAGRDNGIVLLWVPKERAYSLRIARGLKADLSDSDAALITQQHLLPNFKRGQYYDGLKETIQSTMAYLGDATWEARIQARVQAPARPGEQQAPSREAPARDHSSAQSNDQSKDQSQQPAQTAVFLLGLAGVVGAGIAIHKSRRRRSKLVELAQANAAITDCLAKAEANAPQIPRLLDDLAKEVPEQDLTKLRSDLAAQPDRIVKIRLDATLLDFANLQSYDDVVRVRTSAETESDLLEVMQQKIANIKRAKQRSQALIGSLSQQSFAISDLRDSSRRAEIDGLLSGSRQDYEQARRDSSMSLVDWLLINELLDRSQSRVQQAVQFSQEAPYTPPPSSSRYESSSSSYSSSSYDSSSSYSSSSSSDGGGSFDSGSGSDGTY
jgi:uncharacterized membrane protein YgcG